MKKPIDIQQAYEDDLREQIIQTPLFTGVVTFDHPTFQLFYSRIEAAGGLQLGTHIEDNARFSVFSLPFMFNNIPLVIINLLSEDEDITQICIQHSQGTEVVAVVDNSEYEYLDDGFDDFYGKVANERLLNVNMSRIAEILANKTSRSHEFFDKDELDSNSEQNDVDDDVDDDES